MAEIKSKFIFRESPFAPVDETETKSYVLVFIILDTKEKILLTFTKSELN